LIAPYEIASFKSILNHGITKQLTSGNQFSSKLSVAIPTGLEFLCGLAKLAPPRAEQPAISPSQKVAEAKVEDSLPESSVAALERQIPSQHPAAQNALPTVTNASKSEDFGLLPIEVTLPDSLPKPLFIPVIDGVEKALVILGVPADKPGHEDILHIYRPQGAANKKLPCIFIAGSGSPLVIGMRVGTSDEPEHLPYAKAGFMVIAYDTDGALKDWQNSPKDELIAAMNQFIKAKAGLVNAHNALEYTLRALPNVDPKKIFAVGHSSAATTALMFTALEPRIASCVAYAPTVDVQARVQSAMQGMRLENDAQQKLRAISPIHHIAELNRPVLLFWANDDTNTNPLDIASFGSKLAKKQLVHVPNGGHYDSMIRQGIPTGIIHLSFFGDPPQSPEKIVALLEKAGVNGGPEQLAILAQANLVTSATPAGTTNPALVKPSTDQTPSRGFKEEGNAWGDWPTTSKGVDGDVEWIARSRQFTIKQYADVLASNDEDILAKVAWIPGLSRPAVPFRCAVGFAFVSNNEPPAMRTQSEMERYVGSLGLQIGRRIQKLQLAGKFGSLHGTQDNTLKYVQLMGSGNRTELLAMARSLGCEMVCLVELKSSLAPGAKKPSTSMTVKFLDAFAEKQGWVSQVLSSDRAQGGEGSASQEWLQKLSEVLEEKFELQPTPPDADVQIQKEFDAWQKKKPKSALVALLEIRVAQQRKWIDSARAKELLELVLGEDAARRFLVADESARRTMIAKLLPKSE
jgi:dienelactone hydrolase